MLGISVEPEHIVDEQMRNLKGSAAGAPSASAGGASRGGGEAGGVQGMDIADEGMGGEAQPAQGALVRSGGAIDPYMALALAPKIGESSPPPQHLPGRGICVLSSARLAHTHSLLFPVLAAQNIFSYLSSFAPDSAPQTVPLLQKWLEQFERKLKMQGSAWLEKQGGDGG